LIYDAAGSGGKPFFPIIPQPRGLDGETDGDLMRAVEKFQNLIAEQAPKLASFPRSRRQLDPAISGAAFGTHDIGSSHVTQGTIIDPIVLREGTVTEIKSQR
jgi:hypothetical protein